MNGSSDAIAWAILLGFFIGCAFIATCYLYLIEKQ